MDKEVISLWSLAVDSYNSGRLDESIEEFHNLAEFSKAQFNIGFIYQQRGIE
jgi:hypothetical protein